MFSSKKMFSVMFQALEYSSKIFKNVLPSWSDQYCGINV
ncbi:unnamed protein product [Tenebrio molitor]|nr:unnamed protein product [Tenebrio molitor]